ncbi:rod shape-determining protein MreC [Candidatus Uhrbacteria bacterium]|nr:rod shape-determining protein MreC [Candidatus Uhrbacteria bacterium]
MNGSWRWLWIGGAVAAVLILTLAGIFRPLGDFFRSVTLPVVRFTSGLVSRDSETVTNSGDAERIKELESRLAALTVDYVRLKSLEEENRTLRSQAKFLDRSGYDSVGARVISRDIGGRRSLFMIDRGSEDSLEVGQAVITDDGIFIGKISRLLERVATVELVTDPRSRVAAALQTQGPLSGILEGRGNGASVLTYVPSSAELAIDQLVVTAGTEEKVPGNLPIGFVSTVDGKPTDPFMNASVETLVPLDRVVFISVLRPTALRPRL